MSASAGPSMRALPGGLLPAGGYHGESAEAGLVTPEAVVLGLPLASVGTRAVAILIDFLVQFGALYLVVFSGMVFGALGDTGWVGIAVMTLGIFGILIGYPIVLETAWRGRTLGKAAMGLRVVTVEAAPVGLRHATIRGVLGIVDFHVTFGGVAALCALFTRRGQRLGDLLAGTVVIRDGRSRGVHALMFTPPPGAEDYTDRLDVADLREEDYLAVRAAIVRGSSLPAPAGNALAASLLQAVGPRVTPPPPAGMPPPVVLRSVAAAYQRRHRGNATASVSDWIWRDGTT